MIYGRGKWLYRVIGLAAYNAARRFAARHLNAFGRSQTWRPMVLRWRLRRKTLGNASTGRASRPSPGSWFPQFHFHFASHMTSQTRAKAMPGHFPAAAAGRTRVVMDHRWTSVLAATPGLQLDKAKQAAPEMYERKNSRAQQRGSVTLASRVSWPRNTLKAHFPGTAPAPVRWLSNSARPKQHLAPTAAQPVSRPPLTNQVVTWTTQPERRQFFDPRPEVRASLQRGVHTRFLQTRSQIWQHWQQVSSRRQPEFRDPVANRQAGTRTLQFQYEHSEQLVWRRTGQTPLTSDDDERGAELSESASRTQGRPQPDHESAVGVAVLPAPAAATQVTRLDPAVLDRLTDHVISRVEQRMRIERQRRGL